MLTSRIVIMLGVALSAGACGGNVLGADDHGAGKAPDEESPRSATTFLATVNADSSLCLPQPLARDRSGVVKCRIVEALPDAAATCDAQAGLIDADAPLAATFRRSVEVAEQTRVCELEQLPQSATEQSCAFSTVAGWCYVEGAVAGNECQQALRFSPQGQPAPGVLVAMACTVER